jgi:hypothetical protein
VLNRPVSGMVVTAKPFPVLGAEAISAPPHLVFMPDASGPRASRAERRRVWYPSCKNQRVPGAITVAGRVPCTEKDGRYFWKGLRQTSPGCDIPCPDVCASSEFRARHIHRLSAASGTRATRTHQPLRPLLSANNRLIASCQTVSASHHIYCCAKPVLCDYSPGICFEKQARRD